MNNRSLGLLGGLLSLFLVLLYLAPTPEQATGPWIGFLGHFHPLVVHFPIGLVVLALVFEVGGLGAKGTFLRPAVPVLLGLGILSSLASVLAGFWLYRSGEYGGEMVQQHFQGGIALTIGLILAFWIRQQQEKQNSLIWRSAYWSTLLISNVLLLYTGHLGGSLTHGEAFLSTEALFPPPPAPIEEQALDDWPVFEQLMMPMIEENCQACHNTNKTKGGLLMTSYEAIQRGGKSGRPMLVAGQPEESELLQRILLPMSDDAHMPPEGKAQPDSIAVQLLAAWISVGASDTTILGELCFEDSIGLRSWLDGQLPQLAAAQRSKLEQQAALQEVWPELQALCHRLGLLLMLDENMDSTHAAIAMQFPPSPIGDWVLPDLLPYAPFISKLSLPSATITDEGLFYVGQMSELRNLYLQKTCLTGDGIVYLQDLPNLQLLNLSLTDVDEAGLLYLLQMPQLQRVYVFDANLSPRLIEAMRHHLPETQFLEEEGPYL